MLAALETINCSTNNMLTLTIGNLDNLVYLTCNVNSLTSLDASGLASLKNVECSHNALASLNVSGSFLIEDLRCNSNDLSDLEVTDLGNLHILDIGVNNISQIDLSNQQLLEVLWAIYNPLTTVNVNTCMFLDFLDLRFTPDLVSIYMKNTSNETLQLAINPSLEFICCDEDEVAYVQNLGGVATGVSVGSDCALLVQEITADIHSTYPNPVSELLHFNTTLGIDKIAVYDLSGKLIAEPKLLNECADFRGIPNGVYVVKMSYGESELIEKVIVAH